MIFFGRRMWAHRIAYIISRGKIPAGLLVCHTCDNRACCNPAHLFLGTPKENTHDMMKKGRARKGDQRGEKSHSAILSEVDVHNIRMLRGLKHREIAEIYGVSRTTISAVLQGRTWSHL